MYIDDIKLFAKNEKDLESLIPLIYSQDIGMEFGIEKCAIIKMKSGKLQMMVRIELSNQEKTEHLEKRKITST